MGIVIECAVVIDLLMSLFLSQQLGCILGTAGQSRGKSRGHYISLVHFRWYPDLVSLIFYSVHADTVLETHEVRELAVLERELGTKVLLEHRHLLHSGEELSVNLLLEGLGVSGGLLNVVVLDEKVLVVLDRGSAGAGEGGVGELRDINSGDIDLGGGGDGVDLVHAAERHTVHLEGAGHEEKARLKLLEEHHAVATEAAGEDNQHSARGDGGTELGLLLVALTGLERGLDVVSGVEAGLLLWMCERGRGGEDVIEKRLIVKLYQLGKKDKKC